HIVDVVLYLEGEPFSAYRLLRGVKNRFGSTNEVGLFEMGSEGLTEVYDPSCLFMQERQKEGGGSAIAVSLEGSRPLLVEVQALVSRSYFGVPQRRVSGLDYNRTCLMLAVLERRAGLILGTQDVFLSVAGGLAVSEPAVDLAAAVAVASSLKDVTIDHETVVFGELGLGGEIRAVTQPERRIREAARMGFKRAVLPQRNFNQLKPRPKELELKGVNTIQEALEDLMAKPKKQEI
ncbi:DNA repair protein RadA, partial [bacterium]|nr:DNA repair protein RadA [bacterium]